MATIAHFEYEFDDAGNRTMDLHDSIIDGTTSWEYDATNQLKKDNYFPNIASTPANGSNSLSYDAAGNRLNQSTVVPGGTELTAYTYNHSNCLKTAQDSTGITTYTYDLNGNRLTIDFPGGEHIANVWDKRNRLVQVEYDDTISVHQVQFIYNADGLLIEKDDDGTTTRMVYDGNNRIWESTDGMTQVVYTSIPGEYGQALSQREIGSGESHFYHWDGLKNVRAVSDDAETLTDEYSFDGWGEALTYGTSGSTSNTQRYKGQYLAYRHEPDAEPAPQYACHFRTYDPSTGTFNSQDPAEDDLNLYRYVQNNPINKEDPSGLEEPDVLKMFSDWVWGKHQAIAESMDSVQQSVRQSGRFNLSLQVGTDVFRGASGYVAHNLTVYPTESGADMRESAFAGGAVANSSIVGLYDLATQPSVVLNRAIGIDDDAELVSDVLNEFAESLEARHATYGRDFVPLFETEMEVASMLSVANTVVSAPTKIARQSSRSVLRTLNKLDEGLNPPRSAPVSAVASADSALGKALSLNPDRAQAQLLHALRAADTVESRAVAALIKRGKLDVTISGSQMYYRGQEVAGQAIAGTNQVVLYRAALGNSERAAGVLAHEAKHFLQKAGTRVNPYHRGLEFEAIKWQTRVDSSMHWMGDAEVWERVNRVYWNVPAPPSTWKPNLGGGIR